MPQRACVTHWEWPTMANMASITLTSIRNRPLESRRAFGVGSGLYPIVRDISCGALWGVREIP
jgi:hypothetical protein